MQTLTATYRIVTPMFLGDANKNATDIRPPSIKGALRFWWRALNWGRFRQNTSDDAEALCNLNKAEAELFGAAAVDGQARGQSKILLAVKSNNLPCTKRNDVHQHFANHPAARYLGYGLMEAFSSQIRNTQAGQLVRSCINENKTFTVRLNCRDEAVDSVREALIALGVFGGLGSRSRHGMGGISLEQLTHQGQTIWEKPTTLQEYKERVAELIQGLVLLPGIPPYSAFSKNTRIDVLTGSNNTPYSVLNEFASGQMFYRSWGHNGMVLGQNSERRFRADHDWYRVNPRDQNFHPQRVVFGLPHNYGPKSKDCVEPENYQRRSSPLLFHVHELGDNSFIGVSLILKSTFLPEGERINAGGNNVTANIDWNILTGFIDGNIRDKEGNPRFQNKHALLKDSNP